MFFNSNHVETSITSSAYTVVAVNGNKERNVERNRSALKAKERVLLYPPVQKQASALYIVFEISGLYTVAKASIFSSKNKKPAFGLIVSGVPLWNILAF